MRALSQEDARYSAWSCTGPGEAVRSRVAAPSTALSEGARLPHHVPKAPRHVVPSGRVWKHEEKPNLALATGSMRCKKCCADSKGTEKQH